MHRIGAKEETNNDAGTVLKLANLSAADRAEFGYLYDVRNFEGCGREP